MEPASVSQSRAGEVPAELTVDLGGGVFLELVGIRAGEFMMGQGDGCADEKPVSRVRIESGFLAGRFEVTNEQFARFDPSHDSRVEDADFMQFSPGERGWAVSRRKQPVVRVSWHRAMDFCRWLSKKTGRSFTLPTEAEWEFACRAGTTTALWYGGVDGDFSRSANVSDICNQLIDPFDWAGRVDTIPPWRPADTRFNDRYRVSAPVGTYRSNAWGLFDMHGNVAEWTMSEYRPYPYDEKDGRNSSSAGRKVVRGGSWYDRPDRCRSAFRQAYSPDHPVYDVGFRVVCR
jgi:formylglycine-generating enzyme required for sulfatase activity